MKCNNCNSEMENLFYNPEGCGYEILLVTRLIDFKAKEFKSLGTMKFCPKCGNVQVNIDRE